VAPQEVGEMSGAARVAALVVVILIVSAWPLAPEAAVAQSGGEPEPWLMVDGFAAKTGYRLVFFWSASAPVVPTVEWGYAEDALAFTASPPAARADTAGIVIVGVARSQVDPARSVHFRVVDGLSESASLVHSFSLGNAWRSGTADGVYELDLVVQIDSQDLPELMIWDQGLNELVNGMEVTAERIWDATDGYVRLGTVLVTDTVVNYPVHTPFAHVICGDPGSVYENGLADVVIQSTLPFDSHTFAGQPPAIDDPCTRIHLGRIGQLVVPWSGDLHFGAVLAHEIGHYAMGFDDLYPSSLTGNADCWVGTSGEPDNSAGRYDITMMHNQFGWSGGRWVGTELDRGPDHTPCNYSTGYASWPRLVQTYDKIPAAGRNGDYLPDHSDSDYATARGNPDGGHLTIYVLDHEPGLSTLANPVTPSATPLQAAAGGPYETLVGQEVAFEGSATGGRAPYAYAWDFGDGSTAEGRQATHAYAEEGMYTARVTVTDADGATDYALASVRVDAQETQPPAVWEVATVHVAQESARPLVGRRRPAAREPRRVRNDGRAGQLDGAGRGCRHARGGPARAGARRPLLLRGARDEPGDRRIRRVGTAAVHDRRRYAAVALAVSVAFGVA
jgi:hypothetical protein